MTARTPAFHAVSAAAALAFWRVDPARGLSREDAQARLSRYGPNVLAAAETRGDWAILIDQFKNLLTALLGVAALVSFAFGDLAEGVAVLVVIMVNAAIGFSAERRAVASIAALRKLGAAQAAVRRDGAVDVVPADQLVPGDVVLLEAGDVAPADLRLIAAAGLECDESLLTGESAPVAKTSAPVASEALIAERRPIVFKGASVTRGSGEAVVVATGPRTELGAIAVMVQEATEVATPLERRLEQMSRQLALAALVIAVFVLLTGLMGGRDAVLMVKTGIALAIAAIPEGLPVVATLALARGMWRLARRNALVERLSAVETLGAVTVILTDKTGTLTENRMAVTDLVFADGAVRLSPEGAARDDDVGALLTARAARVMAYCGSAALDDAAPDGARGDPMEIALLQAARRLGPPPEIGPKLGEEAFDAETRMMAVAHAAEDGAIVLVKGAPEAVLETVVAVASGDGHRPLAAQEIAAWLDRTAALAARGRRVLALAEKRVADQTRCGEAPYEGLTLIGLAALRDPPRPDARAAVEAARGAGVKVVMITGDNAVTGASIAHAVGLTDAPQEAAITGRELKPPESLSDVEKRAILATKVFARVSPKQKLDLAALHQEAGEIVAMTGDGVNDGPALKKADIGVAMGRRGTQVAKEAADVILNDDAFASIIAAIRQGRVIFANIRRFVIYLLSCNVSEVLVVAIGAASGLPLPLLPLQILFLNLVTDVFPALALGAGEGDGDVLKQRPRPPGEPLLTQRHWIAVGVYGLIITAAVLAAFIWATLRPDQPEGHPATVAFLTIALAQMWHVFNMRGRHTDPIDNEVTRNPFVWGALGLCLLLLLAAVYVPPLAAVLKLTPPDPASWAVILGASAAPLLVGQLLKHVPISLSAPRSAEV